jgi:hypothetical protein
MFLFFDNREAEQNKEDCDTGALTEQGAHNVAGEAAKSHESVLFVTLVKLSVCRVQTRWMVFQFGKSI